MGLNDKFWFHEELYPDIGYGFKVSSVIHAERSPIQDIQIFDTPALGKVLVLDGVVQCSQKDEAIYHEMLAHSGIFMCLAKGKAEGLDVLVVGGGDGGIARECLKHDDVKRVTVVDIDPRVRAAVLAHFPEIPKGAYSDPRLLTVDQDAAEFLKRTRNTFDLIIADTPDPIGVAKVLFGREFTSSCKDALTQNGVFVRHGGSMLLQTEEFINVRKHTVETFGNERTRTSLISMCSYLGGWFSIVSAIKDDSSLDDEATYRRVKELFDEASLDVCWYTPDLQFAMQALAVAVKS